jgi:Ni/Fe-hydrogenase 1 B-type cytochrome subunit
MIDAKVHEREEIYLLVRTRSVLACALHWILVLSVITLVLTGLYIGDPRFLYGQGEAYNTFIMAWIRTIHFWAATSVIVVVFIRVYLAFTNSCNKDWEQFVPTWWNIKNAAKLAWYYITFRGEAAHAHYRFVNPLGGIGIFGMIICVLIQIATGFLLYLPAESNALWWSIGFPLNDFLGGTQNVRNIHHLTMFILLAVIFIHVYMQVWKNIVFSESDISSIIGGYKIFPISEVGHFADHYGLHIHDAPPSQAELAAASHAQPFAPDPE